MKISVRKYRNSDLEQMIEIWNEVVREGVAFPQEECLTIQSGKDFSLHRRIAQLLKIMKKTEKS